MKRYLFLFALLMALGAQSQTVSRYGHAEQSWIRIVPPSAIQQEQSFSGSVPLADSRKLGQLSRRRLGEAVADEIRAKVGTLPPGMQLSSVELTCYGAPTGNARRSEVRGSLKLQDLKNVLRDRLSASKVTVAWVPEDWDRIILLTGQMPDIPLQAAALDIMEHVDVQQGRGQQLKMLAGGETWRRLQQQVFPDVERIDYKAVIQRRPVASADGSSVTLQGLYGTAQNYKPGSDEYYDIIDLAARLFPESVDAAVNAAGVALLRGDVQKAAGYLHPLQKDPRADLHLGVLFLLHGDATRSEVHLRLAESRGIPEAASALRALKSDNVNW